MIAAADWLTSVELRSINLQALQDGTTEYVRASEGRSGLRHRIGRIRDGDLRRLLSALPPFPHAEWRQAWSHFMALVAGRHLFPDANHRTALTAFNEILFRSSSALVLLEPAVASRLVQASKAMRDPDYLRRGRYYSARELADDGHPYRRLFRDFESFLRRVDVEEAVRDAPRLGALKEALEREGRWPKLPATDSGSSREDR